MPRLVSVVVPVFNEQENLPELLRRTAGTRVASAVPIQGSQAGGLVVLRADGTLPSFVPGVPGLPVHMTAQMHEEESL